MLDDKFWILDGKEVVRSDMVTWSSWLEHAGEKRVVAKTNVSTEEHVSTVFLGLNHQYGKGPPLLFETLVFGGPHDGDMERYSTWAEAEAGHKAMVERLSKAPRVPKARR